MINSVLELHGFYEFQYALKLNKENTLRNGAVTVAKVVGGAIPMILYEGNWYMLDDKATSVAEQALVDELLFRYARGTTKFTEGISVQFNTVNDLTYDKQTFNVLSFTINKRDEGVATADTEKYKKIENFGVF